MPIQSRLGAMEGGGLSDEAASAACSEGHPITQVSLGNHVGFFGGFDLLSLTHCVLLPWLKRQTVV